MDVKTSVREFLVKNFLFGDSSPLTSDSLSLLDSGIMDSIGVMELVNFLELELKIEVPDADLIPENLDSVNNLTAFIERQMAKQ
ncbi:MAG: acyl carrier protein [Chloroflexi bacterium]|nr:MAG: acyl carrier protein [Chloroflexota bacterium]